VQVRPKREFPALLFRMRGSALAQIWPLLLAVGLFSSGLTWLHETYDLVWLELTPTPFSIVGIALSIFLGFRNGACYDRWWEGRKLWGALINSSRTYARQVQALIDPRVPEAQDAHRELILILVAYAHALRMNLRKQRRWEELRPFLPASLADALAAQRNVPAFLLHQLGLRHREAVDRGWLHPLHLPVLEGTLTQLTDIQGGCERIKNTPVPLSYTELTHHIVALYVILLPFGLLGTIHALTPLVDMLVAYCFLGLDAVGSQIENPFEEDDNDLPLFQMSRLIENDLRQRLDEVDLPPDIHAVDGILL
jgi:ion channel-forming bestrophin family protein